MKQETLVPKRRFSGFDDEWEKCEVSEVGNTYFGGGTPKTSKFEYWGGNIPWIQSSDVDEGILHVSKPRRYITDVGLKNSATQLVPADSIAIVTRVGVGKLALMPYEYSTSQDFFSISDLNVDSSFGVYMMYKLLQSKKNAVQGTSIKGITKNELLSMKIWIAKNTNEQQKIGQFFKHLDEMIALQQRKIDKTLGLKSAYLAEMFPAEGERVPKRRFEGFTGEWNKKRIGDITDSFSGGTPSAGRKVFYGGNIPFIRSGEVNAEKTKLFITDEGLKNSSAKLVEKGDILYALYGATSGEVGISRINGAINQAVLAIKPKNGYNSYFITQLLKKQKKFIIEKYLQGGQGNLSGSIVKQLIIDLPADRREQQKIGAFFKNLDDTIMNHQRKLDKLKATKQAYLHEMFV